MRLGDADMARCRELEITGGILTGMPMKDLSCWITSPLAIMTVWRGDSIEEDGWKLMRIRELLKASRSDAEIFRRPGHLPLGALVCLGLPLLRLLYKPRGGRIFGYGSSGVVALSFIGCTPP